MACTECPDKTLDCGQLVPAQTCQAAIQTLQMLRQSSLTELSCELKQQNLCSAQQVQIALIHTLDAVDCVLATLLANLNQMTRNCPAPTDATVAVATDIPNDAGFDLEEV